ncbi:MarR family winged helix-turn-helix transcriptional regulator [Kitasatospora sp. NPDC056651]|uniref:MarR family winged helix-turn-helix transcriptional regulator n=1 Tax=Kitasatospora sp. NPDC056651 TaxID=3345892 RepID=UPI0036754BA6
MDGVQLLRLGKRLTELGRELIIAPASQQLTPAEIAVIADVFRHPAASAQEVRVRTGFAQSHVSVSVARLREQGLLEAAPDPDDGRRTLLTVSERARQAIHSHVAEPAEPVIAKAVPDPEQARRVTELLDELAVLLLP